MDLRASVTVEPQRPTTSGPLHEWRRGWRDVLVGVAGMLMISSGLYTLGVFLGPLQSEFGWTRVEITGVTVISALISIILGPFVGHLVDRLGPRAVGVPGSIAYCVALAMMALTTRSIWTWWVLWAVLHIAGLLISPVIWTSAVARVFARSRGLALALTLGGAGLALATMPTASRLLVDGFGWRRAFVGLALCLGVTVVPLVVLFLGRGPAARRAAPPAPEPEPVIAGAAKQSLMTLRFAKLALVSFLFAAGAISFTINLVPILTSIGLSRTSAAGMGAVLGAASVIGRVSTGSLLDRFNADFVGAATVLTPIFGCLCLILAPTGIGPILGVFVIGLAQGAEYDVIAYLVARHFGTQSFGTLFAILNAALGIGAALGPILLSRSYDMTGSYLPALWTVIPLYGVCGLLLATLGWRGPRVRAVRSLAREPTL